MTIHEVANEVDNLIQDKAVQACFTDHIARLCKMVEDYGQAQQPYSKKLEDAGNRIERSKDPKRFVGKFLTDICPPPKGYVKMNYWDNDFVNVPMGTIYRPVEPVNPLLWFGLFGNANLQRKPTEKERLMCEYVRLAIIHDYAMRYSGTPTDSYIFSDDYRRKWFKRDDFCEYIWKYYRYDNRSLSQLNRALRRVQSDLVEKPAEIEMDTTSVKGGRIGALLWKLYEITILAIVKAMKE